MSLWDNEGAEPWDKNVPPDLIPAIEHLYQLFDEAHVLYGSVAKNFCYTQLCNFNNWARPGNYARINKSFVRLSNRMNPAAVDRFNSLIDQDTLPSIFKGYFEFYLEGLQVEARHIFYEFLNVGRANEQRLHSLPLEWAESQTKQLIRSHRDKIKKWVRDVCDESVYEPKVNAPSDLPVRTSSNAWQAPAFLLMEPCGCITYDAAGIWSRFESGFSLQYIEAFADQYVLTLDIAIARWTDEVALELAKQPKQGQQGSIDRDSQHGVSKATGTGRLLTKGRNTVLTRPEKKRREAILHAIQANDKGIKYCKTLDECRLSIPEAWAQDGCPTTYVEAYRNQKWRKRIQDEKSRYKRKIDATPAAEREKPL